MIQYREIIRLHSLGISQHDIAFTCCASKTTVNRVIKAAKQNRLFWPLDESVTDSVLETLVQGDKEEGKEVHSSRRMPNFDYIHRELLRNGVNKRLLWTEYLEECRLANEQPFMYSQFCHHIMQHELKRRATLHINRNPGEQVEVDWAGDPAHLTDPDTGEFTKAFLFVGVLSYSHYTYVEAFLNEKEASWIMAHNNMFHFFGGVPKIVVPDNCRTAVTRGGDKNDPRLNKVYQELAEHYGTAIIPARPYRPKDKPKAEGAVKGISTWITAALRNEQFFSLHELNQAIQKKLLTFNENLLQKKQVSRSSLFFKEEKPLLLPLPLFSQSIMFT